MYKSLATEEGGKTQSKRVFKAFTLAEVLITLVVIGIIAAITVPTLMAQHQKTQTVAQLKKSFATIQNGFKAYLAKEGVTSIEDSTLWAKMPGNHTDQGDITEFQKELATIFVAPKQFKFNQISDDYKITYKYLSMSGSEDYKIWESVYLNDGSVFYYWFFKNDQNDDTKKDTIRSLGGKYTRNYGYVFVDVNGFKKPNVIGRDLFWFVFAPDGTLFPCGGKDASLLEAQSLDETWESTNSSYNCLTNGNSGGYGCTARIIDEGWEIKY